MIKSDFNKIRLCLDQKEKELINEINGVMFNVEKNLTEKIQESEVICKSKEFSIREIEKVYIELNQASQIDKFQKIAQLENLLVNHQSQMIPQYIEFNCGIEENILVNSLKVENIIQNLRKFGENSFKEQQKAKAPNDEYFDFNPVKRVRSE